MGLEWIPQTNQYILNISISPKLEITFQVFHLTNGGQDTKQRTSRRKIPA